MRSSYPFRFQSDQVFTYPLDQIRKCLHHSFQSDPILIRIKLNQIDLDSGYQFQSWGTTALHVLHVFLI